MSTPLLTVAEVAEYVRLSPDTVRAAIREGELSATRVRGRLLVTTDDLAAWMDAGRVSAASLLPTVESRPAPRTPAPAGGARQAVRARKEAA